MGKKFLIVEDDKINRLIMKKALQKTDAIILEAENGKTALEIIRNKRPDLVLMDIQMPDISGVEVIKTIRNSNDAIKNTKIIAVSGYSQEKEINAFLDAGADDFISKPVENRKLFEIIFKNLS
jgi:CheY-like chemotaxis protein